MIRPVQRIGLWLAAIIVCVLIASRADYTTDLSAFLPAAPTENQRRSTTMRRSR